MRPFGYVGDLEITANHEINIEVVSGHIAASTWITVEEAEQVIAKLQAAIQYAKGEVYND